ncbi:MAG: hypothetical protein IJP11_08055 [Oscillospiraceae bacterium]|nr:hypothetical protein [Oscillospiraceae bacterium]
MRQEKKIIISIIWIVLGITLLSLGIAEVVDSYWSGMGSALTVIGLLQLIRFFRFRKDAEYREAVETETKDERNAFLRNKAWAWAGYLFVLFSAVASIVLKIVGHDILSMGASWAVCLIILFYWGSYMILRKKY